MIQNDSKCVTAAPLKFMLMLLRRSPPVLTLTINTQI